MTEPLSDINAQNSEQPVANEVNPAEKYSLPNWPHFLPLGFIFEQLPEELKGAFAQIVLPAYYQLVVMVDTGLERSAGNTLVFLLIEELLQQFELGQGLNLTTTTPVSSENRERAWQRYLKLVNVKQTALDALAKVRNLYKPRMSK